jgi:hypothetical protein
MNRHIVSIALFTGLLFTIYQCEEITAQQPGNLTNPTTNFTKLFQEKYSRAILNSEVNKQLQRDNDAYSRQLQVAVEYESPTTILISGQLITETDLIFNTFLLQAMDMLKNQYGFKLQQIFTSGQGSKGNPTNVYILMTK